MKIKLSKKQFDYVSDSLSKSELSLSARLNEVSTTNQFVIIEIDEMIADEIRDWASEKLQKVGFDINYNLVDEGKILEELIDLFYVE